MRRIFQNLSRKLRHKTPPLRERFSVGRGTYGEPEILHWGEPATLEIGAYCSIAENVTIFLGGNHRVDWITTYPFNKFHKDFRHIEGHPQTKGDVIIGNDVWVGQGAMIMSGVTIGDGAVIGAASLVTRDIAPYTVVGGNPAREIKKRFPQSDIDFLLELQWWNWPGPTLDQAIPILLSGDVDKLRAFAEKL